MYDLCTLFERLDLLLKLGGREAFTQVPPHRFHKKDLFGVFASEYGGRVLILVIVLLLQIIHVLPFLPLLFQTRGLSMRR